MKKIMLSGGVVLAVLLSLVGLSAPAQAHTPNGGATCDLGVYATATGYEAGDTNNIAVVMDNQSKSQYFDTDASLAIPIPDDGVAHTYTWWVHTTNANPAYSAGGHGTLTCGTPVPPVKHKHGWVHLVPYCNAVMVEGTKNATVVKTYLGNGRYKFEVTATHGATLHNGSTHRIRHAHVKRTGCGDVSGY